MIRLALQAMLLLVLVAACSVLVVRGADLMRSPIDVAAPHQVWAPSNAAYPVPTVKERPLGAFPQTLARPIFFEGRRFPQTEAVVPKPPPAPPPRPIVAPDQFRIFGIVTHGEARRALIQGPSVLLDWYTEGAKLQEWTLTRIENNSIFLSFGDQSAELRLFRIGEQN